MRRRKEKKKRSSKLKEVVSLEKRKEEKRGYAQRFYLLTRGKEGGVAQSTPWSGIIGKKRGGKGGTGSAQRLYIDGATIEEKKRRLRSDRGTQKPSIAEGGKDC